MRKLKRCWLEDQCDQRQAAQYDLFNFFIVNFHALYVCRFPLASFSLFVFKITANIIIFVFINNLVLFKNSQSSLKLRTSASGPSVTLLSQGQPVRDVTPHVQVASTLTSTINEINMNSTLIYSVTLSNDSILNLKYQILKLLNNRRSKFL